MEQYIETEHEITKKARHEIESRLVKKTPTSKERLFQEESISVLHRIFFQREYRVIDKEVVLPQNIPRFPNNWILLRHHSNHTNRFLVSQK